MYDGAASASRSPRGMGVVRRIVIVLIGVDLPCETMTIFKRALQQRNDLLDALRVGLWLWIRCHTPSIRGRAALNGTQEEPPV